jgi:DNA-directed RNA polymerase specialized sigma24 family protein
MRDGMRVDDRQDIARVGAAQGGDQRALDELIAGYLPLVYNIVGRALDGHADVDDVVQETMLRVVDGLGGLRDPASFRSWLVAIAMRQVRDRVRARQAAPLSGLGLPEAMDVADPGADFTAGGLYRVQPAQWAWLVRRTGRRRRTWPGRRTGRRLRA